MLGADDDVNQGEAAADNQSTRPTDKAPHLPPLPHQVLSKKAVQHAGNKNPRSSRSSRVVHIRKGHRVDKSAERDAEVTHLSDIAHPRSDTNTSFSSQNADFGRQPDYAFEDSADAAHFIAAEETISTSHGSNVNDRRIAVEIDSGLKSVNKHAEDNPNSESSDSELNLLSQAASDFDNVSVGEEIMS